MTTESKARDQICAIAASMFARGLTSGASGNLSVRVSGGWLVTPTGVSMGGLDPARLAKIDDSGRHVAGDAPTKELMLHRVMYAERPTAGAVVHLHATHSVAVSCLADIDPTDVLPPLTAYYVMRVGRLPLVEYFPPGDKALADAVRPLAGKHHAVLLANHGPIVAGTTLEAAASAIEELEETARLHLLLAPHKVRYLSPEQVDELRRREP